MYLGVASSLTSISHPVRIPVGLPACAANASKQAGGGQERGCVCLWQRREEVIRLPDGCELTPIKGINSNSVFCYVGTI